MKRRRVPSYRLHKQSGQAIVTLPDSVGNRKDFLLGVYGSSSSRAEYARVIAEWEASSQPLSHTDSTPTSFIPELTINELLLAYWGHVEGYYVKEGKPSRQQHRIKQSLKPLRELYGHTLVKDFGPKALKAVREQLIQKEYVRRLINQMVGCVKQCFKWGCSEELVPPNIYYGLQSVPGLKLGRTQAPESKDIQPVSLALVEQTLPYLSRQVAAMVRIQLLTGARSGEVCQMRTGDLDMSGDIWFYRPQHHKTSHHGKERLIAIGPKCQEVIRPFLKLDLQAYLFSPAEAEQERLAQRRAQRKSKVPPSQWSRKRKKPKKKPGACYSPSSYARSIRYAIAKAKVPHWHPHQLRHTHATEVRRQFGLDGAQVALGHSSADVTQVYAERDGNLAIKIARELG